MPQAINLAGGDLPIVDALEALGNRCALANGWDGAASIAHTGATTITALVDALERIERNYIGIGAGDIARAALAKVRSQQ